MNMVASISRFPQPPTAPLRLSVVMAVYNEVQTIESAIERVLAVDIDGVEVELIVVESNSSDGTRPLVARYASHPRVQVVLQDEPRGKGAAVREGFVHATGGIVLIQDADLEYSVEDYPKLIEPIERGEVDFVLGSRHAPGRSVRVMDDAARHVAPIMNAAHWVFTWFFNVVYGTKLRDPFTMYKVFRRECIEGVEFVADRFDFDWEIVGKLVRLGYVPIEIPVEYHARSFHRGKKVRFFRDPPTWVVACLRFRFSSLPTQQHKRSAAHGGPRTEMVTERTGDAIDV